MNPFPRTSTPDEIRDAERKAKEKVTFSQFQYICHVAVFFSEKMDMDEISDVINEWYAIYRDSNYGNDAAGFLCEQQLVGVNRNSHDFWLDERGLLLLKLKQSIGI